MGKFLVSAFIALGLSVSGANLLAAEEQESTTSTEIEQRTTHSTSSTATEPNEVMVEGQVIAIEGDTLKVKDSAGYNHSFKVTDPTMLNEFKSGDNVEILVQSSEAGMTEEGAPTSPAGTTGAEQEPVATTPAPTPTP
jgi:Cu/Ag efflux protein CusF